MGPDLITPKSKSKDATNDTLYHVIFKETKPRMSAVEGIQNIRVAESFTCFEAAKTVAQGRVWEAGYEVKCFNRLHSRAKNDTTWVCNEDIEVYASTPNGGEISVSVARTPNDYGFVGDGKGRIRAQMFFTLLTRLCCHRDPSTAVQHTEVYRAFPNFSTATKSAKEVLLGRMGPAYESEWAVWEATPKSVHSWKWGENVVLHAVTHCGEDFLVSVVQEQKLDKFMVATAVK